MIDCIEHTQRGIGLGYGSTTVTEEGRRRRVGLHRAVYCKAHGLSVSAIDGLVIRHTCDNPRCINPAHLLLGTTQDNVNDRHERSRTYRELTPEQVLEARHTCKRHCRTNGISALARKYGVDQSTLSRAVNGHGWEDVCLV